uniref:Uncharacterized protein n=1 Tax=Strongyloides venezuelensis TaxID=75913 RepID=A0A0K0F019_STRVS
MLRIIKSFLNYVYELIFGENSNNKKKKYVYDTEYNEYQRAFASGEYYEDEYGNQYSAGEEECYAPYYYASDNSGYYSPTANKRNQLRKRRIRRKKILKKPPFIVTDNL